MAPAAVSSNSSADDTPHHQPFEFNESVQSLVDASDNMKALPSKYNLGVTNDTRASSCESLPVIDYSALTSSDPHQRSKAVTELTEASADWGFFVVMQLVNHGVSEELIGSLFATVREFFSLPDDEKKQYEAKSTSSPIACGNFNLKSTSNETFTLQRILVEYNERTRKMAREMVGAVVEFMELDRDYVEEALELDSSFQKFGGNFYPACPQPDQTIGLPPHNDPGLFTILLIHNRLAGLQIERKSHWFEVNSPPNSMIVNVGDHLEVTT
ncbi:hypothetical protein SASPL_118534 [Salvia splendens]|uniref:Flavonol synthase n=1 Tax=Salvia splendens TaxID=180675 RepID=A0A8X8XZW5_SALSN|nr:hypothetical protein SASPL_118534 [Salvia splendens]